ncbi:UvrD-helicase domain-containing protein [Caulobacter sp. FWC26]|jgi:superfamily I DNA/RNA helicase|uniref:UvrD-helicase domain-containing protein n=1 Tax=Caulobacter sp. FWC26 TaxID=69665 RepID=UPI000C14F68A|nr:ATP-dependent helicase [Caulobacter sp. FWC26]AZS21606.1 ATP-dependent helicase [Caulobacter sp. FWC26]
MIIAPDAWSPPDGIQLDTETMAAVRSTNSSVIVAGPGAGKTELLAQRAAYLLATNCCKAPRRILAISFKRDAARNLQDRVALRAGEDLARRLESYTFDAFAKSLLDRFGSALPEWCRPARNYDLAFPGWRDWNEFSEEYRRVSGVYISGQDINNGHATLLSEPGPLSLNYDQSAIVNAVGAYWWNKSLTSTPPRLTFGMIATLVMTLLRHNPQIRAALQRTYSHVFLDEFQDTNSLQYGLLKEAFLGSDAIVTAVGDSKQKIMTFAGARSGIFREFAQDFQATAVALTSNFRSNSRIVDIVNAMARRLEPDAVLVRSARPTAPLPNPVDGVLHYSDAHEEAEDLARTIAENIRDHGHRPADFMLLVRQSANQVEQVLAPAFATQGLVLRNEARNIGDIQIQDLMTEPLADLVIGVIQMGVGDRENAPFHRVRSMIGAVFGDADDRPASEARVERAIRDSVKHVRQVSAQLPTVEAIPQLVDNILAPFGDAALRQLSDDYAKPSRLSAIRDSIVAFLQEGTVGARAWIDAIHRFLGSGQVRLMTIHKSKGLEAHTVIFLHLQDNGFNSNADMAEEALTFFVAASRARERFFITTTSSNRARVEPLWEMVRAAGIAEIAPPTGS